MSSGSATGTSQVYQSNINAVYSSSSMHITWFAASKRCREVLVTLALKRCFRQW